MAEIALQARGAKLSAHGHRLLSLEIERAASDLTKLLAKLDPVKRPHAVFDPGNPLAIGFFIALAMTAQPRQPMSGLHDRKCSVRLR